MNNLARFKVSDLSANNSELIFILESPHNQEIKVGYPAAGKTGVAMSRALFNIDKPLGELVVNNNNNIPLISLVNCSRLPLQKSCYENTQLSVGYATFLEIQEVTDRNLDLHKEKIKEKIRTIIGMQAVSNFKGRLLENIIKCDGKKIIVCGIVAQCFFEEATGLQCSLKNPEQVIWEGHSFSVFYEYHPSPKSGKWQNPDNMKGLLKFIANKSIHPTCGG